MHLNVVDEGKSAEVPRRGIEDGEKQEWQPCNQRDNQQAAI